MLGLVLAPIFGDSFLVIFAPAGLLVMARGVVLVANYGGALERAARADRQTWA